MKSEQNTGKKSKAGWWSRIRSFFIDTVAELRRCTWPTRKELGESTVLVVVVVVILSLFVWGVDIVARAVIALITTGKFN